MASIEDRWIKGGAQAARYGCGLRYRVHFTDADGHQRSKSFADGEKRKAADFIQRLDARHCLVPVCRHVPATELPVPLCGDHLDQLLAQLGRKRPNVHPPLTYFALNGSRVKIGWTTNIKGRMRSLSLPMSAVILTLDGGPERETALHHRFAPARIRGTEWFKVTPEVENYIRSADGVA